MYPIKVGTWRTPNVNPMQAVSGAWGKERIHFEAPTASRLNIEMRKFLKWFNDSTSIDAVLKAGVAHLWFIAVHPFEDGNGRIARAIADMQLARSYKSTQRFYSIKNGGVIRHFIVKLNDIYPIQISIRNRKDVFRNT